MSESEKLTINMGVVDLGKIDLLVQEGFYANRTDFIRTSVRNHLDKHGAETQTAVKRHSAGIGIFHCSKQSLEKALSEGKRVSFSVIGMLHIDDSVSADLANDTIESIRLWGVLRASDGVKKIVADRMI